MAETMRYRGIRIRRQCFLALTLLAWLAAVPAPSAAPLRDGEILFAYPAGEALFPPGAVQAGGEARLRSRRLGAEVAVPARPSGEGLYLELSSAVPPDWFDAALPPAGTEGKSWRQGALRVMRAQGTLRVVHLSDLHYDGSPASARLIRQGVEVVNLLDPDLVLCSGDTMSRPESRGSAALKEILGGIAAPVFCSPGNHDHYDPELTIYRRDFSEERFYSFEAGEFHFIALDTGATYGATHRGRGVGQRQLEWLEADLKKAAGKRVYVFMHHSPVNKGDDFVDGRERFLALARSYGVKGILAGHIHRDLVQDLEAREVSSWGVTVPVIHTTTVGGKVRGKFRGIRLLVLGAEGVLASSPFESIPLRALQVSCDTAPCRLVNATAGVIPGVRIDPDGETVNGGKWPGSLIWSGWAQGIRRESRVIDLEPGELALPAAPPPPP